MSIPDIVRTAVEQRAGHRCEYCHSPLWLTRAQVDHIVPRACGGTDAVENLALACDRCNGNKSEHTQAVDPLYGAACTLFHPRRQRWDEHFLLWPRGPVGRTATGRATASLLFSAKRADYPQDLEWHWAVPLRDQDPALYAQINRLRAWRLGNRFTYIDMAYNQLCIPEGMDPNLAHRAAVALTLIRLETLFTRSRPEDLPQAARLLRRVTRTLVSTHEEHAEVQHIASIVYQQIATRDRLAGNYGRAVRMQRRAVRAFEASLTAPDSQDLRSLLRLRSMKAQVEPADPGRLGPQEIEHAEAIAAQGELRPLAYAAELVLSSPALNRYLERVLDAATRVLEASGYGQDADYANAVVLRRRWWGLRFAAGEAVDLRLLSADLRLWRRINMHNELREIRSLMAQVGATRGRLITPELRAVLERRERHGGSTPPAPQRV